MKRNNLLLTLLIITLSFITFLFISCSNELKLKRVDYGRTFDKWAKISGEEKNSLLNYKIGYQDHTSVSKLSDSLYFQGDLICYHIRVNRKFTENEKISTSFVTGKSEDLKKIENKFPGGDKDINTSSVHWLRDLRKGQIGFLNLGTILKEEYSTSPDLLIKDIEGFSEKDRAVLFLFLINDKPFASKIVRFRIKSEHLLGK